MSDTAKSGIKSTRWWVTLELLSLVAGVLAGAITVYGLVVPSERDRAANDSVSIVLQQLRDAGLNLQVPTDTLRSGNATEEIRVQIKKQAQIQQASDGQTFKAKVVYDVGPASVPFIVDDVYNGGATAQVYINSEKKYLIQGETLTEAGCDFMMLSGYDADPGEDEKATARIRIECK